MPTYTANGITWNFTTYVDEDDGNTYASIGTGVLIDEQWGSAITDGSSISGSVTIPDTVSENPLDPLSWHTVKSISDFAFYNYKFDALTIPDSVTTISRYAVFQCLELENLTIGKSVKTIGDSAFSTCTILKSVIIPDSVELINIDALSYCYELNTVTIGTSVHTIGESTFYDCDKLDTVIIANGQKIKGIDNNPPEVAIPSPALSVEFFGTTVNTVLPESTPAPAPVSGSINSGSNNRSQIPQRYFLPNIRMTFIRSNNHYYKPHTAYGRVGASCQAGNLGAVRRRT